MPYIKDHCYHAECSGCGVLGENGDGMVPHEDSAMLSVTLVDNGWREIDGQPYCPECWHYEHEGDGDPVVCSMPLLRCAACKAEAVR